MYFTCKARCVLNRYKTTDLIRSTHGEVIYREIVQISLSYSALNGMDISLPTLGMPIFKIQYLKRITSSLSLSLKLIIRERLIWPIDIYMGGNILEETSETTSAILWGIYILFTVLWNLIYGWGLLSVAMYQNIMSTAWFIHMMWLYSVIVLSKLYRMILGTTLLWNRSLLYPIIYILEDPYGRYIFGNGVGCWPFSYSHYVQEAVNKAERHFSKQDDVRCKLTTKTETLLCATHNP